MGWRVVVGEAWGDELEPEVLEVPCRREAGRFAAAAAASVVGGDSAKERLDAVVGFLWAADAGGSPGEPGAGEPGMLLGCRGCQFIRD